MQDSEFAVNTPLGAVWLLCQWNLNIKIKCVAQGVCLLF